MISSLLLAALLATTPEKQADDLAHRFLGALSAGDIRAFVPLSAGPLAVSEPSWRSVRDLLDRYEQISLASSRTSIDPEDGTIVLEIDATGITKNEFRECRAIPRLWYLTKNGESIVAVEGEGQRAARELVQAVDEERRRSVAEAHRAVLPDAARAISEDMLRRADPAAEKAAAFLLDRSRTHDDAETETYALLALATLRGDRALADAAREAAQRSPSCDAAAYADLVRGWMERDPERKWALLRLAAEASPLEDPRIAIRALRVQFGIAYAASDLARSDDVLRKFEALSRRFRISQGILSALHGKTTLAAIISDYDRAIVTAKQLAAAAHESLSPSMEATAWELLGQYYLYRAPADYARSAGANRRALQLNPATNDELGVFIHVNLGTALIGLGRTSEAATHLEPALAAGRRSRANLVNALDFGALVRRTQGRYEEALAFAREGIEQDQGALSMVWTLESSLGEMLIECGDADAGIEHLRRSIDLIEARRSLTTNDPIVRARHFATRAGVYRTLMRTLVDQKRPEEAWEVAERIKARSLTDSLAGKTPDLPLTESERASEQALYERIIELNRSLITATGAEALQKQEQLRVARNALEELATELAIRYSPSLPSPGETPALRGRPRGPIIEYAVLDDSVVAFVVSDGSVVARRLPRKARAIERDTRRLDQSIQRWSARASADARVMYDALIAPIARLLPRGKTLTIVPDGFLWNVPFDALMSPSGTILAETRALTYAPSVAMLDRAADRREPQPAQRKTLLALGDPFISVNTARKAAIHRGLSLGALPDAVREVRAVGKIYGADRSTVLIGRDAREAVLKQIAGQYRVLHLATHGIIDHQSPLYSAVVLARSKNDAEDGLLEAREMLGLDLHHADVVVLSGCDTAQGELYEGEGVIGMSWALLSAGCPTTIVSRWKADSRSTAALMIEFHKHLAAGDTAAEALRRARLALRSNPWYEHPFYWAPFIVVGQGDLSLR